MVRSDKISINQNLAKQALGAPEDMTVGSAHVI
jgi:hypothetical protein